jgi:hypothetical protein
MNELRGGLLREFKTANNKTINRLVNNSVIWEVDTLIILDIYYGIPILPMERIIKEELGG